MTERLCDHPNFDINAAAVFVISRAAWHAALDHYAGEPTPGLCLPIQVSERIRKASHAAADAAEQHLRDR